MGSLILFRLVTGHGVGGEWASVMYSKGNGGIDFRTNSNTQIDIELAACLNRNLSLTFPLPRPMRHW
jgi:hypothetical protein